jgi:hypothetical protein
MEPDRPPFILKPPPPSITFGSVADAPEGDERDGAATTAPGQSATFPVPSTPRRRARWRVWALAGVLVVALATGGIAAWKTHTANSTSTCDSTITGAITAVNYPLAVACDQNGITTAGQYVDVGLIVRYNADGAKQWEAAYQGPNTDCNTFVGVAAVGDGGAIATGFSSGDVNTVGVIVRYGADGTQQWQATYQGPSLNTYFRGVAATSDGGAIAAGDFTVDVDGNVGVIVRYSADGTQQWQATYQGPNTDTYFYGVAATSDGGAIAAGSTYDDSSVGVIVRYSADGTQQWEAAYQGPNPNTNFYGVAATSDGGAIATGYSGYAFGNSVGVIVRYSADGTQQWQATHQGPTPNTYIYGVAATSDGGANATGYSYDDSSAGVVVRYSADGAKQWDTTYQGPNKDSAFNSVAAVGDGGAITAGSSFDDGSVGVIVRYSADGKQA